MPPTFFRSLLLRARNFTINVDAREKKPLPFYPRYTMLDRSKLATDCGSFVANITIASVTMKTADYVFAGESGTLYALPTHSPRVVIERKAGLDEIAANCLHPHKRALFIAALQRMREVCESPVLILEGGVDRLLLPTAANPNPGLAADALLDLSRQYSVPIIPAGGDSLRHRYFLGEYVIRYLLSGVLSNASTTDRYHP